MVIKKLINVLLPPRCVSCGEGVEDDFCLCAPCWRAIDFIVKPFCDQCGHPLGFSVESDLSKDRLLCTRCYNQPCLYDHCRSAVSYNSLAKQLILQFKHADAGNLSVTFARWLKRCGQDLLKEADYIVPVPLHWTRLLKRRYNQAALLALSLLPVMDVSALYAPFLLRRRRITASQGHKNLAERQVNVQDAFAIPQRYHSMVQGKKVVLIDDVMTTGATLNECSRVLKQAGCHSVHALTIARVILAQGLS